MAARARRVVLASLGASLGTAIAFACAPGTFACTEASDCRAGLRMGTCELDGWCSFPDDGCPSGARYGDHAGDGLAGECVPPGVVSTGSEEGPGPTSSSGPSTSASTNEATTTGDPGSATSAEVTSDADSESGASLCGNGLPDPGEPCDDGNDQVGDGCNPGCIAGGEIVWSVVIDGGPNAFDGAFSLEMFADGELAVGVAQGDGMTATPGVWRMDQAGATLWSWSFDLELGWSGAYTWGLDIDELNEEAIAVTATVNAEHAIAMLSADGEQRWSELVEGTGFAVAIDAFGESWAGGRDGNDAGVVLHWSSDGLLLETIVGEPLSPVNGFPYDLVYDGGTRLLVAGRYTAFDVQGAFYRPVGEDVDQIDVVLGAYNEALAVAYDPIAEREWVVGYAEDDAGGQGWVAAYEHGEVALAPVRVTQHAQANLHGVAVDPSGAIVAVGWETPELDDDLAVLKVAPSGEVIWSRTYPNDGDDALRDVVIADDGSIFVAGQRTGADGSADGWIARLAP